jgi:hypothetical protein
MAKIGTSRVPIDADDIKQMLEALNRFCDETGQLWNQYDSAPLPGSQAAVDRSRFPNSETPKTPYGLADVLIEIAGDHLIAFTRTMEEPVPALATWTCVRGALESGALACWLLDTTLSTHDRIRRSFAFRYKGLREQVKFARATSDQSLLNVAKKRIDEVENDAFNLGYNPVLDKNNKRNGIGQVMPSITNVITETLDGEFAYRLLSAMAHGHHWATQQLGFQRIGNVDSTTHEKSIDLISVAFLSGVTADAFSQAIYRRFKLYGWDLDQLRVVRKSTIDAHKKHWANP